MTTRIYKGRDGWQAQTDTELDNNRVLRLNTYKSGRGGVITNASVHTVISGSFLQHELFGDYNKNAIEERTARCTEKTVTTQHQAAQGQLDAIKLAVANFYAAKATKETA